MVKKQEVFLMDSNSLITPSRLYYAFDLVPSFWDKLKNSFQNGRIVLLDKVKNELLQGDDELSTWVKENDDIIHVCTYRNANIVSNYQKVLQYVQTCGYYKESALASWAPSSVADPWLIATALANAYVLVSVEAPSGGLSKKNKNKNAKIPDVARAMSVECISLYEMMRRLELVL